MRSKNLLHCTEEGAMGGGGGGGGTVPDGNQRTQGPVAPVREKVGRKVRPTRTSSVLEQAGERPGSAIFKKSLRGREGTIGQRDTMALAAQ